MSYPHRIAPEAVNGLYVSGRVKLYKINYFSPTVCEDENVKNANFESTLIFFRWSFLYGICSGDKSAAICAKLRRVNAELCGELGTIIRFGFTRTAGAAHSSKDSPAAHTASTP